MAGWSARDILGMEWFFVAVALMLLLWAAMTYVAVRGYKKWAASRSPLGILKERFARIEDRGSRAGSAKPGGTKS